ncbi:MAG TPA: hypothetical protein VMF06_08040 [Candidatus Limnocylindria bacterium]|jgi:hypothetical protein|nr:hypothetical protein [Candidatus Limnocylindria bacterium]
MEWHIQSRARTCHHTGKVFADGDVYHTVLIETPSGFERMDLSAHAWKELSAELFARPGVVSHWKGIFEAAPAVAPDAIGKDDAEALLRKILVRKEEQYEAVAYILAVMLERKRILKLKGQSRETGRRILVYEHPKSGDVFPIVDPNLQLAQLEAVEHLVTDLLAHGLPPDPIADSPAVAPVEPTPSEGETSSTGLSGSEDPLSPSTTSLVPDAPEAQVDAPSAPH